MNRKIYGDIQLCAGGLKDKDACAVRTSHAKSVTDGYKDKLTDGMRELGPLPPKKKLRRKFLNCVKTEDFYLLSISRQQNWIANNRQGHSKEGV